MIKQILKKLLPLRSSRTNNKKKSRRIMMQKSKLSQIKTKTYKWTWMDKNNSRKGAPKINTKSSNNKRKSKNKSKTKSRSKITKSLMQTHIPMLNSQPNRKTMIANNKTTTIQKIASAKILHWWSKKITLQASLHFLAASTEIKYLTQHLPLSRGISLLTDWGKYRAKQSLNNNTIILFYHNLPYTHHNFPSKSLQRAMRV